MKRHMWYGHFRTRQDAGMGVSCSDPEALLRDALRLGATAVSLFRGEEIKGKTPSLMELRGIMNDRKRKGKVVKHMPAK